MPVKSPSTIVYDFAKATVIAAAEGDILKDAEVQDSAYQEITKNKGIVVSNAEWNFAPNIGDLGPFDSLIIVGFYWRIKGTDTTNRADARNKCYEMALALTKKIFADQTLGGRVCDNLLLRATDGMRNTTADDYAVINLPIILNPTGEPVDYQLGEAK